jgi:hypothetical protein
VSTNAHGGAFEGRNRRVLAQQGLRADAADAAAAGLTGRVDGLEGRVQALEDAPPVTTGNLVRTVVRIRLADVVAIGGSLGPATIDLTPALPPGSHIVNWLTKLTTPFVSATTPFHLETTFEWAAYDSVAPDASPYVVTIVKGSPVVLGDDVAAPATYDGFAATGPNADPFAAGVSATAYRWPYTPTMRAVLASTGPNFDQYTDGELEIIVLSVTML